MVLTPDSLGVGTPTLLEVDLRILTAASDPMPVTSGLNVVLFSRGENHSDLRRLFGGAEGIVRRETGKE